MGPHSRCQVLRDSRLRDGAPGSEWSGQERQQWGDRAAAFVRKCMSEDLDGERSRTRARTTNCTKRLASLDWLRALEHSLVATTSFGFEQYMPLYSFEPTRLPPILMICCDQEQKQLCPLLYLRHKVGLNMEYIVDVTHRRHRDLENSITASGLKFIVLKGHIVANAGYGPWKGMGFQRDIQEAALDVSRNLSPNDEMLMRFWPSIAKDLHLSDEGDLNEAGWAKFLEELPDMDSIRCKGPHSSLSRWCSYHAAVRFHDPFNSTLAFVITFISIQKGCRLRCLHYSAIPPSCLGVRLAVVPQRA